jgi:hypothetical protein
VNETDRKYLINYTITQGKMLKHRWKEGRITGSEMRIAYNELRKVADMINYVVANPSSE